MDVPGVKASDIYICVKPEGKNNIVIVSGERSELLGPENTPRKFSKNFPLDQNVDTDSILAELSNGVLVVSATKRVDKKASSKRILVKQITDDDKQ
jgi:HSP20 family molecular chaperone IbpA